jgi:phosphoglucosamine mutase
MRREGYVFGGEQSGHLIFSHYSTTGDGILAALQVLSAMKRKGRPLSELSNCMEVFPQVLLNVKVKERKELSEVLELCRLQKDIEKSLGGKGRILLRYSGTEPLLRIMLEGEDLKKIQDYAQSLKSEAVKALGAA